MPPVSRKMKTVSVRICDASMMNAGETASTPAASSPALSCSVSLRARRVGEVAGRSRKQRLKHAHGDHGGGGRENRLRHADDDEVERRRRELGHVRDEVGGRFSGHERVSVAEIPAAVLAGDLVGCEWVLRQPEDQPQQQGDPQNQPEQTMFSHPARPLSRRRRTAYPARSPPGRSAGRWHRRSPARRARGGRRA